MILTALVAYGTGKNVFIWTFAAFFGGWVALVLAFLIPGKQHVIDKRMATLDRLTEEQYDKVEEDLIKKRKKDFNTVDDLFAQLEKK